MPKPAKLSSLLNSVALFTLLTPAVAVISSAPAFAETAAESENDDNVIVVTARGREESVIEVPIAISVLSQDQLNAAGVSDIQNMSDYTPGFKFQNSDGQAGGRSSSALQFRGISQQVDSAASRTGAVFYDGSYVSQGIGFIPMIDLERVEVIKGPQNAYFARNTFSGAVNFVPKEPGDELEVSTELQLGIGTGRGEQVSYRGVAAIGGPITDTIGLRVATTYERKGADYEYLNGDPNGEENNFAIFGTAVFEVTPTFRVKATGYYVDSEDTSNAQSVNATVAPGDCNMIYSGSSINGLTGALTPFTTDLSQSTQTIFCGSIPDASVIEASATGQTGTVSLNPDMAGFTNLMPDGLGNEYGAWRANLSFDWELGTGHTIKGLASRGEAELVGVQDFFYGETGDPTAPSAFIFPSALGNWTQDTFFEARVASEQNKRLRYEIGVSYYEQKYRNGNAFQTNFQDNAAFGVFGTVDFDITDEFTISGEGRWVDDKQTLVYVGAPGVAAGNPDALATIDSENSYTDFMPRVILSYSPHSDLNIYASWSQSSLNSVATNATDFSRITEAAGLNLLPDPTVVGDFTGIQRLTSYEFGVKQRFSDWLSYSIAAYYMEWDNQPFSNTFILSPFSATTLNLDGNSEYKGIDFEIILNPVEGLQIMGSVGWVDAELKELGAAGSVTTQVLCPGTAALTTGPVCTAFGTTSSISGAGNQPANVSEWSGAVSASYAFPIPSGDLYVRADALYSGERYQDNFAYNKIDDSWRVNVRVGADVTKDFRVEAFVENLFQDKTLSAAGNTGIAFGAANTGRKAFATLPEKREVGFRLMADF